MRLFLAAIIAAVMAAPAAAMELEPFRTPSGNIHCLLIGDDGRNPVECELRSMANANPALPRPADCDLDWGSRFYLDASGNAGMVCHGDTLINPDAPALAYGRSISRYGITCNSERTGLTCRNRKGHGFSLARAGQHLF